MQVADFFAKNIVLYLLLPFAALAAAVQPAQSQIETSGRFGTSINGGSGTQSCISGVCAISGGTDAGSNKFHRFTLFDANRTSESSISGVTIETDSQSNVILGVASSSNGFNLSVPLSFDSSANLFIVSPDGVSLSTGAFFSNVTDLTLTNLSTLPVGLGQFSVNSSLSEVQLLTGTPALSRTNPSLSTVAANAPITIGGITLTVDGSLYVHANSDLTVSNAALNASSTLDVGGNLTISGSTLDNNSSIILYAENNLGIYDSTVDGNTTVDIDSGNILTLSDPLNASDTGVSISDNTIVTMDSTGSTVIVNANLDNNDSLKIVSGGDFDADDITSVSSSGVSIDQNTSLTITSVGDFLFYRSSISDNSMVTIDSGGDFVFFSSNLIGNLPYSTEQYESDFDVVDALAYFTIDAVGMIDIDDSSIDFNGPFTLISSSSDLLITNSDFLDNLYPYLESVAGDITIASSLLSRNAFIDAYAKGDAYIFDTSVVGNDLVIGAEQGDTVVVSSDLADNVIVATSTGGDSVIVDSVVDNNILDVESETGDAAIANSDVTDSDVLAVSSEGDVVVFGSNVDESVFEAAALAGNIDVLNSEFINNQELAFVADFDVSISDSAVSGNELVVIDVGNDALINSSDISGSDALVVDAVNNILIESSSAETNRDVFMDAGNQLSIVSTIESDSSSADISAANNVQNPDSQPQGSVSSESQTSSQETASAVSSGSADSGSESGSDASTNSESTAETSSDSNSETASEDDGKDSSSSTAANKDASVSQSGESSSNDSGGSSAPSFQISTVDANVVASNLRDSIDSNTAEVLSALGLDAISPTPASELTPARISQSLNDARQVYQSLSVSSLNHSVVTVASTLSSTSPLISSNLSDASFNPAYLNISFTKNSDLGIGDFSKGFVDLTLITSDDTVIGRRTELPLADFASLLRGFYGKISTQRSLEPALETSEASRLYSLFLEPLQDVLNNEKITTVLVSADRGLQAIPFSALAHQGQFAVENISFSFTPSLSLTDLSIPLADLDTQEILIMGTSQFSGLAPLPFVTQEINNIGKYYSGPSLTEEKFTSSRALSNLSSSNQSLIHLATHADFKGGRPADSMIHTSDGSISFESFKSIRRERQSNPMNLFVLSACRSALGDSDSEMGLAGLALQAGSKSAIGSLWYVDDMATSAFFSQFYRYLSLGVPKSTALTQTQRDFASGDVKIQGTNVVVGSGDVLLSGISAAQKYNYPKDFSHPFFWSGFVLLGAPW